jgi:hypothetical protein
MSNLQIGILIEMLVIFIYTVQLTILSNTNPVIFFFFFMGNFQQKYMLFNSNKRKIIYNSNCLIHQIALFLQIIYHIIIFFINAIFFIFLHLFNPVIYFIVSVFVIRIATFLFCYFLTFHDA